jgi:hypothetical protein
MHSVSGVPKNGDVTATAARGNANHADGIGPQQVHHPPRRRLLHGLRAPLAVMHRRALAVVAIARGATSDRRRLVRWLPEGHVRPCKQIRTSELA